jgi:hypothetical protein
MGLSSTDRCVCKRNGAACNASSNSARAAGLRGWRAIALATLTLGCAFAPFGAVRAQIGPGSTRFVDVIELSDHDDQADITIQFNCSMRYITHLPASEGAELHVELQPLADCGTGNGTILAGELPPVSGGSGILSAARVESDVPGQISLVLTWRKPERFVVAQGVDPRGLRVRLFDRARGRGKILLNEPSDTVTNFAVNLDSETHPFDPAAIQAAHDLLKAPAFVSETTVDGQKWYRLRIGPIERRKEADRLLAEALPRYPRAWLAIGDDAVSSEPLPGVGQFVPPGVQPIGADAALDPATLKSMVADAEAALRAHDYPKAITLLTRLQRQPEFPQRSHVQELLGLARERSGQLAHAKAEYEEYLLRYPNGEAAERVANRLRILRAAAAKPPGSTGGVGPATGWTYSGGIAQLYRYDGTRVDSTTSAATPTTSFGSVPTSATVSSDVLFNDVDFMARRRGDSIDFMARLSGGYAKDLSNSGLGDSQRLSVATVEMLDRSLGLMARLGRQSRNDDGILGTFDGLFLSYQFQPAWAVNVSAGYPVELTSEGLQTERRFEGIALAYAPPGARWDASIFTDIQQFDGVRDRQAVGFEGRYLAPRASLIVLTDYDTAFQSLNTAALLGTVQLPWRWSVSLDAERRNAPVLSVRNALIGQPATTIAELEQVFTLPQIDQLARDRTPITANYSMTATHPLGERFQFSVTAAATETAATVASGGVDAQPSTGLNRLVQMQLYGTSVWHTGDFNVINLTYATTEVGTTESLGITTRFPLYQAWRIGPRLVVDRESILSDGSHQLTLIPSVLIDFQHARQLLQFELGGEIGKRDALLQAQNTQRYYVSLAYRIGF